MTDRCRRFGDLTKQSLDINLIAMHQSANHTSKSFLAVTRSGRSVVCALLSLLMMALSGPFSLSHAIAEHGYENCAGHGIDAKKASQDSEVPQGLSGQHCVLCFSVQHLISKPSVPTRTEAMAPVTYTAWETLDGPLDGPGPLFKPPRL